MDFEQARNNMVEQQIRTWEVLDQSVLDSISQIERDKFVPDGYENLAYSDTQIPLGYGEHMMPPKLEARIVQALGLGPSDRSLEIGTGSGYLTALLADNCAQVTTVEIHETLLDSARARLEIHGFGNINFEHGDGIDGWKEREPFEAIVLTGSLATLRPAISRQLTIGGRMFAVIGEAPVMDARLITRVGNDEFRVESLFETELQPLVGGEAAASFKF